MDYKAFVVKFFFYGCIGLLIEIGFTGLWSLFKKNWKLTGHTYLWMIFPYGFTAITLEALSLSLSWPFWLKAFLYVPVIYGVEALFGWALKMIIGSIPWDYTHSRWSPFGLINFRYALFWLALALVFDPISGIMGRLVKFMSQV